jgi:tetratricopeptide (TPR) repeat protein
MRTWNRASHVALALVLALGAAGWGPAGPGATLTKEQLAYSKQVFAEGDKAMKAGDFAGALAKFKEGYRYAPHLHVFTYSIGSAAEAMGDCRTALTYFRMFLDLVPEHPERKTVQAKHDKLAKECKFDVESEEVNSVEEQSERQVDRKQRDAIDAMNDAVVQLRAAQQLYAAARSKYPDVAPLARAAKHKKKDAKRMAKLAAKLDVKLEASEAPALAVPGTAKEVCREGVRLEHRIIEAAEAVMEHYDARKAYNVASKVLRAAERDEAAFEGCR